MDDNDVLEFHVATPGTIASGVTCAFMNGYSYRDRADHKEIEVEVLKAYADREIFKETIVKETIIIKEAEPMFTLTNLFIFIVLIVIVVKWVVPKINWRTGMRLFVGLFYKPVRKEWKEAKKEFDEANKDE